MVEKKRKHIIKVRVDERQKQVTIPKDAKEIQVGDYVEVIKHE